MKPAMVLVLVLVSQGLSAAAPAERKRAVQFDKVVACRSLADQQARLACYDSNVDALSASEAKGDIVVVDREEVRQARRSLFGLNLPSIPLLGSRSERERADPADEVREIASTARAVSRDRDGNWLLTLEDGARWEQTDRLPLAREPRIGSKVVVKRASFGSFKMNIDGEPAVRARRVN